MPSIKAEATNCSSECTDVYVENVARSKAAVSYRYAPYFAPHQRPAVLLAAQSKLAAIKPMLFVGQQQDGKGQSHQHQQVLCRMADGTVSPLSNQSPDVLAEVALDLSERSIEHTLSALHNVRNIRYAAAVQGSDNASNMPNVALERVQAQALTEAETAMRTTIKRLTIAHALATAALLKDLQSNPEAGMQQQHERVPYAAQLQMLLQQRLQKLQLQQQHQHAMLQMQHQQVQLSVGWPMEAAAAAVLPVPPVLLAADLDDCDGEAEVTSSRRMAA